MSSSMGMYMPCRGARRITVDWRPAIWTIAASAMQYRESQAIERLKEVRTRHFLVRAEAVMQSSISIPRGVTRQHAGIRLMGALSLVSVLVGSCVDVEQVGVSTALLIAKPLPDLLDRGSSVQVAFRPSTTTERASLTRASRW